MATRKKSATSKTLFSLFASQIMVWHGMRSPEGSVKTVGKNDGKIKQIQLALLQSHQKTALLTIPWTPMGFKLHCFEASLQCLLIWLVSFLGSSIGFRFLQGCQITWHLKLQKMITLSVNIDTIFFFNSSELRLNFLCVGSWDAAQWSIVIIAHFPCCFAIETPALWTRCCVIQIAERTKKEIRLVSSFV